MKILLRTLVTVIFILSGFVKAVDLKGFSFKLEEYFSPAVFDMPLLESYALPLAVIVVVLELALGFMLLVKIKVKETLWLLIALCVFFGFLTFYSAYFNVVTDCGCFGDALKLTPWQSFWKDIVLLVMLLVLLFLHKKSNEKSDIGCAKLPVLGIFMAFMAFVMYRGLAHEPMIDFRAYSIGTDIKLERKKIEADPSVYKNFYSLKHAKTGEVKKVNQDDYIEQNYWQDSNWQIEEGKTTTEIVKQGYQSETNKFKVVTPEGDDVTNEILDQKKAILVFTYKPKEADPQLIIDLQNHLIKEKEAKVYGISTMVGTYEILNNYTMDEVASKTIARSNPFVLVLESGKIVEKLGAKDYIKKYYSKKIKMTKSNKPIAGYHLLMILAAVDGEVAPQEGILIQEYLAEEFPFFINLDNELEVIATLEQDQWKDHFEFHARCFYDDSFPEERDSFIKFAKTLIKADETVTDREHTYYKLLKNIWKLD